MSLDELAIKYGTDKSSKVHDYCGRYEAAFTRFRAEQISFLEIGVFGGASLRMWAEFFPAGRVVGIDIDPDCRQHAAGRIEVLTGDQQDPTFLADLAKTHGPFDAIVDDGGHTSAQQIFSFHHLFSSVKPGGFYCVEDLHTSYMKRRRLRARKATAMEFLAGLVDKVNIRGLAVDGWVTGSRSQMLALLDKHHIAYDDLEKTVESLTISKSLVIVEKSPPRRTAAL